jgi:RNA polymerase sigma factor (TIGR02999 family)
VDQTRAEWEDRAHFLALAALAMRHVLVDRARALATTKRGAGIRPVTLEEHALPIDADVEVLLELSDALDELATLEPRLARVVEYRFFGGLTEEEIAVVLFVGAGRRSAR